MNFLYLYINMKNTKNTHIAVKYFQYCTFFHSNFCYLNHRNTDFFSFSWNYPGSNFSAPVIKKKCHKNKSGRVILKILQCKSVQTVPLVCCRNTSVGCFCLRSSWQVRHCDLSNSIPATKKTKKREREREREKKKKKRKKEEI